jgi:hypothetical protein
MNTYYPPLLRFTKALLRFLDRGRMINLREIRGHRPALFPVHIVQAVAHHVHDVKLHLRLLAKNLSLLNLIDSRFTIATRKLQRLRGTNVPPARAGNQAQPQRIEFPRGQRPRLAGDAGGAGCLLASAPYQSRVARKVDPRDFAWQSSASCAAERTAIRCREGVTAGTLFELP